MHWVHLLRGRPGVRIPFGAPDNNAESLGLTVSIALRISNRRFLAYTLSAILLNTLPAIKPPDAGSPGFCMETMQLYLGASAGKYPQKLTR